jgi:hypothetical protein
LKNNKLKSLESKKIIKRCFEVYQGAWNKDDKINENDLSKILEDVYEKEKKMDTSIKNVNTNCKYVFFD